MPAANWTRHRSPDDEAGGDPPWAQMDTHIPFDVKRLYVEALGDLAQGDFVLSSDPTYRGEDIMVQVIASSEAQPMVDLAQVCSWMDSEGGFHLQAIVRLWIVCWLTG